MAAGTALIDYRDRTSLHKLVYFGHHKCGSRFFRHEIFAPIAKLNRYSVVQYEVKEPIFHYRKAHDLDLYNIDFALVGSEQKVILMLANAGAPVVEKVKQSISEFRGLHVVRDPRQILVSNYFHHLEGHAITFKGWTWDQLAEDRPRLMQLDREAGILYELDNITGDILENQIAAWMPDHRILELRLEDFEANISSEMQRIKDFFEVEELPGVNQTQGIRYANPASVDWRFVFTRKIKAVFKEKYGELLVRLGYEEGLNW